MNSVLKNTFQFISRKVYWQQILAVLFLLLAIFFFRSERRELATIIPNLKKANTMWLALGIPAIILCTLFQGGLYRKSFASINLSLKWRDAIALFLKRNFIGVFLPAGSITSLAYSPSEIRKSGFSKMQVHQASGLFAFASLLTVFIAGLPVIIFAVFSNGLFGNAWIGLIILFLTIAGLFLLARSIRQRGVLYKFLDAKLPAFTPFI
jgi:phosphatidylglycerol lysyltransferase